MLSIQIKYTLTNIQWNGNTSFADRSKSVLFFSCIIVRLVLVSWFVWDMAGFRSYMPLACHETHCVASIVSSMKLRHCGYYLYSEMQVRMPKWIIFPDLSSNAHSHDSNHYKAIINYYHDKKEKRKS